MTEKSEEGKTPHLPQANFINHILELSTAAFISIGVIPNPLTGEADKNMLQAKYLIDTLEMLGEKTKGNLTADEEKQLENVLFNLHTMYVKISEPKS
ncbi:MAG: DUF1844 domain-containing protein [Nitrospirae bacterium]|nr:DUF1844 domain-containing protein [Nitrospirota bacterium]